MRRWAGDNKRQSGRGALRRGAGTLTLISAVASLVPGGLAAGTSANSGEKGSSCAHPYRVHMEPTQGPVEGNGNPGEMFGDTRYIKVRIRGRDIDFEHGYIEGSWVARVKGLHLCEARMTFDWRKPFVSHEWHAAFVKIPAKPGAGHILSFVVTAAR